MGILELTENDAIFSDTFVCAESPVFDMRNGRLYWVNIPQGKLWSSVNFGCPECLIQFDRPLGSVVLCKARGVAVAGKDRNHMITDTLRSIEYEITITEECPSNLFNDATVDAAGRLWAGTTDHNENEVSGNLFSFEPGAQGKLHLSDLKLSNGLDWSPDQK